MVDFNFITTCGGPYSMEYANKSHNMMKRHAGMNFNSYCITERPHELSKEIQPISPSANVKGWWNKMLILDKSMPSGWIVVVDVDILIVNSIYEELNYAFENTKEMTAYSDAINWRDCKLSTSFMIFKSGSLHHIYEKFIHENPTNETYHGAGDQGWIYPQLKEILFLDEVFPNFKRSLKFDLSTQTVDSIQIPAILDPSIKIVDMHGRPKPHQISHIPFVKENWK